MSIDAKNIIISWILPETEVYDIPSETTDSAVEHFKSFNLRSEFVCYGLENDNEHRFICSFYEEEIDPEIETRINFAIISKLGQSRNRLDKILPTSVKKLGLKGFRIEKFQSSPEMLDDMRYKCGMNTDTMDEFNSRRTKSNVGN